MPDSLQTTLLARALQGATTIGPDIPAQQQHDFKAAHPVLSSLGALLSGGATDPDATMGPADLLMAALPAAGIAKGVRKSLAMDTASRMARAKSQGYTTPVYHGTNRPFSEFSGPIRNDRGDFGIHVTPAPHTASKAVGIMDEMATTPNSLHEGANIMPLLARINRPFEVKDVGLWKTPANWLDYPGKPAMMKTTNDPKTLQAIWDAAETHSNPRGVVHDPERVFRFQRDLKDILESKGYDSIKYPNHVEGRGEPSYLLLNPNQVRSKFAAFDPTKVGSRDLLASILGAVGISGAAMESK